jgi:hypothetical protein
VRVGQSAGFDVNALHDALDAQRRSRGMSWEQAAREIGGISPSTLTGMRGKRSVEGDGVLAMLRWLGRTPESFILGHKAPDPEKTILPAVGPGQLLRFDTKAMYAALDAQRQGRGVTWRQVANEIGGLNAGSLTRLAEGGRTAFPEVMTIVGWLGRPAAGFTRVSDW